MTTKPTYEQALQWTLDKCAEARDTGCSYIEIQERPNLETGYMLLRHHGPRGKHWVRDDGTLKQWAEIIVARLVEWPLVQEPTKADLMVPRAKPEPARMEEYTF